MKDTECVQFLQQVLPRLRLQWPGFRKVRTQVCKRIQRRAKELGLADSLAYRAHLEIHRDEWDVPYYHFPFLSRCHVPQYRIYLFR